MLEVWRYIWILIMKKRQSRDWPICIMEIPILLTHLPPYALVKLVSIASGNGLSLVRSQAILWTNAELLSIEPLGTNFSEIWIKIQSILFMKMDLKISPVKGQPFFSGGGGGWVKMVPLYWNCFKVGHLLLLVAQVVSFIFSTNTFVFISYMTSLNLLSLNKHWTCLMHS